MLSIHNDMFQLVSYLNSCNITLDQEYHLPISPFSSNTNRTISECDLVLLFLVISSISILLFVSSSPFLYYFSKISDCEVSSMLIRVVLSSAISTILIRAL